MPACSRNAFEKAEGQPTVPVHRTTAKLIVDGTEHAAFTGAKSVSEVQAWIGEHVPSASAANSPSTAADTTQNPSPDSTSSGRVGW